MAQTSDTRSGYSSDSGTSDISMSAVTPAEDARSVMINQVSWGAIFAGAVIAVSAQVVLNMVGVGVGAATLDPSTGDNPTAGAFGIGAGIWFAISTILAALLGGVAAGRLSGKPKPSTAGWHGLTAWAVSTIFVIYLIGSSVTSLVGGAVGTVGNVVGGAASTAGSVVGSAIPNDPFTAIEERIRGSVPADADPEAARDAAIAAVRTALTGTEAEGEQARRQAAQALSQAQGIPVPEAQQQIEEYQAQFTEAVNTAQAAATEAADTATKAATRGALLAAVVLILGALAGWFGGRMGVVEPVVTARRRTI